MPTRNTGTDTPNRAKPMAARSRRLRGCRAARTPMGMPISSQKNAEPIVSDGVAGEQEEHQERQDRDREQEHHDPEQSSDDVPPHLEGHPLQRAPPEGGFT